MTPVSVLDQRPPAAAQRGGLDGINTIGVLNFDPSPRGKTSAVGAIEQATRRVGCSLCIVRGESEENALRAAMQRLQSFPVDGLLAIGPSRSELQALSRIAGEVPLVALAAERHDRVSGVATDDRAAATAATRHLLELGHSTVFHVAGPVGCHDAERRLAGWRDALSATGAEVPEPMFGDWSPEVGYRLGRKLATRPEVTAIFVAGDRMALGVLGALREAGRRVPHDVSVIGFDGIAESEFFDPPLTTVAQDIAELGRRSLRLLRHEIELGGSAAFHETVAAQLIIRASTAPPPG